MAKLLNRSQIAVLGLVFCLIAAFLAPGCAGVPETYVRADRATYDAIAPRYEQYVQSDDTLDADQKESRLDTLKTWDLRLRKAEESEAK